MYEPPNNADSSAQRRVLDLLPSLRLMVWRLLLDFCFSWDPAPFNSEVPILFIIPYLLNGKPIWRY